MAKFRFERPYLGQFDTADLPSDEELDRLAADCRVAGDQLDELGYPENVSAVLHWFARRLKNKIDRMAFVAEYRNVVLWLAGSEVLNQLPEPEEEIPYGIPVEEEGATE